MTALDLEKEVDHLVTVRGAAHDAKAGAVILTDRDEPVYLQGLRQWPKEMLGKRVAADGVLRRRRIYPKIKTEGSAVSQGMSDESWVLEFERYHVED